MRHDAPHTFTDYALLVGVLLPVLVGSIGLASACASDASRRTTAESACHVEVQTVINTGQCDAVASLEDCPAYAAAMTRCRKRLGLDAEGGNP